MWRLRPDVLVAAGWAALATLWVRRRIRLVGTRVPMPWAPRLGAGAGRGVWAYLTRLTPNCLERAVVAQAWLARGGACAPDIVVGVPRTGLGAGGGPAHAWLEGQEPGAAESHVEIDRLPARR